MKRILWILMFVLVLSGCSLNKTNNTFMLTKDQSTYALYDTKGDSKTEFIYKDFELIEGVGYFVTNTDDLKGLISLEGDEIIPCGEYETLTKAGHLFYGTKTVEDEGEEEPNVLFEVKLFNRANGALAVTVSGDVKGTFTVKAGDQSDKLEKKSFSKDASTILGTGKGTYEVTVTGKNVEDQDGNKTKEITLKGKIKVTKDGEQKSVYLRSIKEKTAEELEEEKYIKSNLYVIDSTGKVLYEASESTCIKNEGLPIIREDNQYIVLDCDGNEIYNGEELVKFAYTKNNMNIVGFEEYSILYYTNTESLEAKELLLEHSDELKFLDCTDRFSVLYNNSGKKTVVVDLLKDSYIYLAFTIDNTYIDSSDNIIIESNGSKYIYESLRQTIVEINSFYMSPTVYAVKNDNIYGPHQVYKTGELQGEIENCQLYPAAKLITSNIFPVYIQDEGYTYYNFEGTHVIETLYIEANPFDDCLCAVVKSNESGYSLINDLGEVLTKEYYASIQYLGNGYYAIYNDVGMFGIIDSLGTVVFDIQFTSMSTTPIVKDETMFYMIFNKNGRSYVYDMNKEQTVLFSAEGDMEYHNEGYFKTQYRYYDIHGEEIK